MYLKSIEIHGFKSFANKVKLDFHDGITVIVGPNGSGKSNVADAVRWVLGEQSAKQLRGSNMQDVIFSGSEARKPLGYASVAITFDNADHKLPIDFDVVTVARRVYRSGESEYLINGSNCRLKDIQELFMDTGIGKEGYSIIGQGQIERILSTKPEDRRELFDEAAGIVKFKKRKNIALKNLAEEQLNLSRVTDILSELESQIGPLEKQSIKAKEYLKLREELKVKEANQFLLENEKNTQEREKSKERYSVVFEDMTNTREEYDNTKTEYEKIENILNDYTKALDEGKNFKSELLVTLEKQESEKKILNEQISSLVKNDSRLNERIQSVELEIINKKQEIDKLVISKEEFTKKINLKNEERQDAVYKHDLIRQHSEELTKLIEECNYNLIHGIDANSSILADIKKYQTLIEQNSIYLEEINNKRELLEKSIEEFEVSRVELSNQASEINAKHNDCILQQKSLRQSSQDLQNLIIKLKDDFENKNHQYLRELSKMESMINIAERYDGYGNAIRRVMEKKTSMKGIHGVVADIIKVDKKYEIAIETALGGNIQNIITEDEYIAKDLIEYLKKNHFGRATFLPLTSISPNKDSEKQNVLSEKGVIAYGATLVESKPIYSNIIKYLLGRILVVDNIDNAISLAKKYNYSLRIVTLEGEQLNPGGSLSGGAYKNASNLLGRKRELTEMEKQVEVLKNDLESIKEEQQKQEITISHLRSKLEQLKQNEQELVVSKNSCNLNLQAVNDKLFSSKNELNELLERLATLEEEEISINEMISNLEKSLTDASSIKKEYEEKIKEYNEELKQSKINEQNEAGKMNALHVEYAQMEQTLSFTLVNLTRINNELDVLLAEKESIIDETNNSNFEREKKAKLIDEIENNKQKCTEKLEKLEIEIEGLNKKRDNLTKSHNEFFAKRDELSARLIDLEKESMRLTTQIEKYEEQINSQTEYLWNEYEMTYSDALGYKIESIKSVFQNKKDIIESKNQIKALGPVNVNAIEDYKSVSERYEFMKTQKDDLLTAQESLENIISELDDEMRKTFADQFAKIKVQFDLVFRELFGGGKGTLELTEDEDILEAGIIINAQPPGKKLQNMMQMSGGEKSLTAISLLFAIQNLKPSPFCLLDEIEAALDDPNVKRFANYLRKLTKNSQFIAITHRRGTMAAADILYGITMQEKGVSTLVSVNLIEEGLT